MRRRIMWRDGEEDVIVELAKMRARGNDSREVILCEETHMASELDALNPFPERLPYIVQSLIWRQRVDNDVRQRGERPYADLANENRVHVPQTKDLERRELDVPLLSEKPKGHIAREGQILEFGSATEDFVEGIDAAGACGIVVVPPVNAFE